MLRVNPTKQLFHLMHNRLAFNNLPDDNGNLLNIALYDSTYKRVPTYFGELVYVDESINSLFIDYVIYNISELTLDFDELESPDDTYQFWLVYKDKNGETILRYIEDTPVSSFDPGSVVTTSAPSSSLTSGNTARYRLRINNLHENKPDDAVYWSMWMRSCDNSHGTILPGTYTAGSSLCITALTAI